MYISNPLLDSLILEDAPYGDLTTEVLGIGDKKAKISYFSRDEGILCCSEEAKKMMAKIGLGIELCKPSGSKLVPGEYFLVANGTAEQVHTAWKACLNLIDFYSGMATRTKKMVDIINSVNPNVALLTTRKSIPNTKPFVTKAIKVGGAYPHRLGISETILVFDNHIKFLGGLDGLIEKIPEIKKHCCEKKLIVEASVEEAKRLVAAGVDGIQFDKVPAEELAREIPAVRAAADGPVLLLAAGGVNMQNAAEYAATGIDGIVTSCLFFGKSLDMSVKIDAI